MLNCCDVRENPELADLARRFFGDEIPLISLCGDGLGFVTTMGDKRYERRYSGELYSAIPPEHFDKRIAKIALYHALKDFTGHSLVWGALTGVRPMKLLYERMRLGDNPEKAMRTLREVYDISAPRAAILGEIERAQRGKIFFSPDYINLYVHIPYCTSRCNYCSFVSAPISKCGEQSRAYVELLCDEIERSTEFLKRAGKRILSIYIGGGTPTALDSESFEKVLRAIGDRDCEYTCEAGRPDTIDGDKADAMKRYGVTRVCVNPQTLNDETLANIGRSHTAGDFYRAYNIIAARGFDINCDLIAGLSDETVSDFINSYDGITALGPANITVHSLSKKNGSDIRYTAGENEYAPQMIDYALSHLGKYVPYYLYRQKRQVCNLENIGLAISGKESVNNITTMEETVGVMACGAGAISKFIGDGKIVRFANMRDVPLYLSRYKEKLSEKFDSFCSVN